MSKKILIIVNSLDFFLTHRNTLAQKLAKSGCHVEVITDMQSNNYSDKNIKFHHFEIDRASINPFRFFTKAFKLGKYMTENKYDTYYFVSHKSNILGGLASLFQFKKKTIYSISGLGYAFINKNLLARILRILILFAYSVFAKKNNSLFVFQNNDDKTLFCNSNVVTEKQSIIIPGMGVDIRKFNFQERDFSQDENPIRILFAGRLLIDKGIKEFLSLALRLRNTNFEFHISGRLDTQNPMAISLDYLNNYLNKSNLIYHGHTQFEKMVELYKSTDIFLLPSYREGFPKAAIEAAATGQPLLLSNVPGCRDCVIEGYNGFLFQSGRIEEMEMKLKKISERNNFDFYSKNSRKHVLDNYSASNIANQYLEILLH